MSVSFLHPTFIDSMDAKRSDNLVGIEAGLQRPLDRALDAPNHIDEHTAVLAGDWLTSEHAPRPTVSIDSAAPDLERDVDRMLESPFSTPGAQR
ncbi:hypothetical protein BLA13014_02586 [Burkholderia aenigmatica]|uniref:Uncharacterized protein n=1 Tax=Burkholderia aenigmatica TaxID=2015348 RepID=A0A6P2KR52_9BURK|nr:MULTISPECIES: hypothetical protein [Burkholderia]VWB58340.1 hypothetical protein BLA13014_02586 [Burkholderia aenigmatica]